MWRAVLAGTDADQAQLAELAGVTQGSVSNALRALPDTPDVGQLFDHIVSVYPGPGGREFYWWIDRPIDEQKKCIADHGALISGDFAADAVAPWRVPERVVAYVREPIDLATAGFVLTDASDYTTLVTIPRDPTLGATAALWDKLGVADPVVTAYDVLRSATTGDEDEAVDKLRDYVVRWRARRAHA